MPTKPTEYAGRLNNLYARLSRFQPIDLNRGRVSKLALGINLLDPNGLLWRSLIGRKAQDADRMKTSKGRKLYGHLIDHSTQMRIKAYDKNVDALRLGQKLDIQITRVEVELYNAYIKRKLPFLEFGELAERKEQLIGTFTDIIKDVRMEHTDYNTMTFEQIMLQAAFKDEKIRKALRNKDAKRYQSMRRAFKRLSPSDIFRVTMKIVQHGYISKH